MLSKVAWRIGLYAAASVVGLALGFVGGAANAATLAIVMTGCQAGDPVGKCTGGSYVAHPTENALVRVCGSLLNCWSAGEPKVAKYSVVPTDQPIDACSTPDVAEGAQIPQPWSAAKDPCKSWTPTVAAAFAQPTVPGGFRLTWITPTTNTDGSALTDLAGFWIYSAAEGGPLGKLMPIQASRNTVDLLGYGPGKYQFSITAFNTAGTESALGAAVTREKTAEKKVPSAVSGLEAAPIP